MKIFPLLVMINLVFILMGCNEDIIFEQKTEPASPPLGVVLLSPANNTTDVSANPVLRWKQGAYASFYTIQVTQLPDFSVLAYSATNIKADSLQVLGLRNNKRHYWRIKSHNAYYKTGFSEPMEFTTVKGIPNTTPCPGLSEVVHEGRTYHTVQIMNQCWLRENMNAGKMINNVDTMKNNSIVEKYCYNNDTANCEKYGGFYQFGEAIQYAKSTYRAKGICPDGWHIPTESDFAILIANFENYAEDLKAIGEGSGEGSGSNLSGFSALISGYRSYTGQTIEIGAETYFWSSSKVDAESSMGMSLPATEESVYLVRYTDKDGFSVRCIKN